MKSLGTTLCLILVLAMAPGIVLAQSTDQSAKQDMKDAGHDTKQAAKKTGKAAKNTTNKAAKKTKHGAQKVEDKTQPPPQ
ncbi:MAG TPA: hypothetical protein VJQ82_18910 [Terriglobales bacterium]|nr:hypothetical protein [Terriglobales bacterium]